MCRNRGDMTCPTQCATLYEPDSQTAYLRCCQLLLRLACCCLCCSQLRQQEAMRLPSQLQLRVQLLQSRLRLGQLACSTMH